MIAARWIVAPVLATSALASCSPPERLPACIAPAPDGGPTTDTGEDPVLWAAGDIAELAHLDGARATAKLLDTRSGLVALLGDASNDRGTLDEFLEAYEPTWGRHRWRTRPAVGNHDYRTAHGSAYWAYFCAAAGTPFEGWYSYDLGTWHVIVLASACDSADSDEACAPGAAQLAWLRADLAVHPRACTLAYWHHPRFTSAGDAPALRETWQVLSEARADLVLNGHAHFYERFAPMSPDGVLDEDGGIREIVAGTGGAHREAPAATRANSEMQITDAWGVLGVTLHDGSYDWRFVDVDERTRDQGSGRCH